LGIGRAIQCIRIIKAISSIFYEAIGTFRTGDMMYRAVMFFQRAASSLQWSAKTYGLGQILRPVAGYIMLLLIDNYDSFVHNLARYFERLGQPTVVVRNDSIDVTEARALRPAAIVLSPGPCTPREAGASLELVRELHGNLPMLGVCLGHQVIAEALGGTIVRAPLPVHGQASEIRHDGSPFFHGLPPKFRVGRYHSLVAEPASLGEPLRPTAWTAEGVVMAFEHKQLPVFGVQFHPESILTEYGYEMLANFLRLAGIGCSANTSELAAFERPSVVSTTRPLPSQPVTF
jgi:anthranilate synthase/aminodeoxychorismate synthase-like glutamine amidotransferase